MPRARAVKESALHALHSPHKPLESRVRGHRRLWRVRRAPAAPRRMSVAIGGGGSGQRVGRAGRRRAGLAGGPLLERRCRACALRQPQERVSGVGSGGHLAARRGSLRHREAALAASASNASNRITSEKMCSTLGTSSVQRGVCVPQRWTSLPQSRTHASHRHGSKPSGALSHALLMVTGRYQLRGGGSRRWIHVRNHNPGARQRCGCRWLFSWWICLLQRCSELIIVHHNHGPTFCSGRLPR